MPLILTSDRAWNRVQQLDRVMTKKAEDLADRIANGKYRDATWICMSLGKALEEAARLTAEFGLNRKEDSHGR